MGGTYGRALERDLLTRLGLPDGASEDDVENAHTDVVAFLERAPNDLRAWSRLQIAAADEAYALLSDRTALDLQQEARVPAPTPESPTLSRSQRAARASVVQQPVSLGARIGPLGRVLIGAAGVVGILLVGYFIYASGLPSVPGLSGTPAPEGSQPVLDSARVAQLMQVIQSSPNDIAALQELGDLYFAAKDYTAAAEWEQRILDVDPNNVTAHLALGAAAYNLGNSADAEVHWRKVIEINPADIDALAEAHYDLGFMYFSADPPDVERTIAEWRKVIEIAPDSEIAQTVATHLQTLEGWNASASPTTSGSPTVSGSPRTSGSPRASGSPATSPTPAASPASSTVP